jgi:hypothetical protein
MTEFGRDISCTTSLRTGRYSTGLRLVAEAAFRRLSTPRGTLQGGVDEENYGLDLSSLIGSTATEADAAGLPSRISAELVKDERIDSASATLTAVTSGPSVAWNVDVLCITDEGPFELQLSVNDVSVELLKLIVEGDL